MTSDDAEAPREELRRRAAAARDQLRRLFDRYGDGDNQDEEE